MAVAAAVAAEPTLPVASVARRLGVAPSTLRTWDRRYGVGPSRHTGGRHRRYGPADIGRLELMQRALLSGASTAEAARYALARMPKCAPAESARPAPAPPPTMALRVDTPDGAVVLPAEEPADGAGLGPSRFARRLSAAALAMDVHTVQRLLAEAIAAEGVLVTWEEIVEPVLAALARRDRVGAAGVEVEHMLAECVLAALVRATPVPAEPRNRRPVLLGCVPEERNGLPLYALAAGLAERRLLAQLFGSPMPADTLAVAVRRSLPAAVVLWAARPGADPRLFTRLARGRQRSRLFACGSGWDAATLPAKVELLGDLPAAVDRLEYVLLGHP
ncbi:MerR family transcriptional regulator [Amycolatopsis arida]|uniref:MerR family transcriptional regulator n=1 Tax=Amycolatopsis arida TaxID=587909 RepID=UPI000B8810A4|nr:MerR family transcriptional regulator [Amycolatopsis arida]